MEIGIGKNQVIWIKEQSAKGTPAWPAAADAVLITSDAKFTQDRSFYNDPQKRLTKGKTGRLPGLYKAGEFTIAALIKASGALGTAPIPGKLLKSLLGKETITGSTSVVYAPDAIDDPPIYLTVLAKDNFETILVSDLVVFSGSIKIHATDSEDGYVALDCSGGFLQSLLAGTDATAALAAAAATEITVVDARKFEVGQKVIIGTSGVTSGHAISAINYTTNVLTIAAAGLETEQASKVVVKGWTPAITEAGYLMQGAFGHYQEKLGEGEYGTVLITQSQLDINNGWHVTDREKNDTAFPSGFSSGDRDLSLKISKFFKADAAVYRHEVYNQTPKLIKLQAAATTYSLSAGKRMEITLPNRQIDTPTRSGDAERTMEVSGPAFETAALNDSIAITFA